MARELVCKQNESYVWREEMCCNPSAAARPGCRRAPLTTTTTTTTTITRPPAPFLLHNYIIVAMSLASKSQSQKLFEKLKSHRANKVSHSVFGPVVEH